MVFVYLDKVFFREYTDSAPMVDQMAILYLYCVNVWSHNEAAAATLHPIVATPGVTGGESPRMLSCRDERTLDSPPLLQAWLQSEIGYLLLLHSCGSQNTQGDRLKYTTFP